MQAASLRRYMLHAALAELAAPPPDPASPVPRTVSSLVQSTLLGGCALAVKRGWLGEAPGTRGALVRGSIVSLFCAHLTVLIAGLVQGLMLLKVSASVIVDLWCSRCAVAWGALVRGGIALGASEFVSFCLFLISC